MGPSLLIQTCRSAPRQCLNPPPPSGVWRVQDLTLAVADVVTFSLHRRLSYCRAATLNTATLQAFVSGGLCARKAGAYSRGNGEASDAPVPAHGSSLPWAVHRFVMDARLSVSCASCYMHKEGAKELKGHDE